MSLVAYTGGSSDEDSENEAEEMDTNDLHQGKVDSITKISSQLSLTKSECASTSLNGSKGIIETETENQSWSRLKFEDFLPKPKSNIIGNTTGTDEVIEIGPIPPKKLYGDEDKVLPPPKTSISSIPNLSAKKVQGIVKISIPSMKDFEEDGGSSSKKMIFQPSKKGSGLFSVLPPPKNTGVSLMTLANESGSKSTPTSTPKLPSETEINKVIPGVPKSLVPHAVKLNMAGKRPAQTKLEEIRAKYLKQDANVRIVHSGKGGIRKGKDSDDSDEEGNQDFFSLDSSNDMVVDDPATLEKLQLPTPVFGDESSVNMELTAEESWSDPNSEVYYNDAAASSSKTSNDDLVR